METFRQSRLVLPVADEETFVLARDPERISIKEILDCVRNSGVTKQIVRTDEEVFIEALLRKVDDSVAQALEERVCKVSSSNIAGPRLITGLQRASRIIHWQATIKGASPPDRRQWPLP